ncbi:MAG: YbjN domain-containing protein [Pseudomonadota bacterium]
MADLKTPDRELLEAWLKAIHVEHHLCPECDSLHITALQSLEGVVNSRLVLQPANLLFSTELEIRPMAILALAADLGRINMDYPNLKVFLDVVDDATPQLVVASNLLFGAGVTAPQFNEFIVNTLDGSRLLADECLQLDYLFAEAARQGAGASQALH